MFASDAVVNDASRQSEVVYYWPFLGGASVWVVSVSCLWGQFTALSSLFVGVICRNFLLLFFEGRSLVLTVLSSWLSSIFYFGVIITKLNTYLHSLVGFLYAQLQTEE